MLEPLDFPPLASATVPDDRIVVAVERDVPQLPLVVAGVVEALRERRAGRLTLLFPQEVSAAERAAATSRLPAEVAAGIHVAGHDPQATSALAYLAAAKDNKPIYFNRLLFDADLILPVGCLRSDDAVGYAGVQTVLFPAFSTERRRSGSGLRPRPSGRCIGGGGGRRRTKRPGCWAC